MATKNISLKTDAYNALKKIQMEGESFSDTIIRITRNMGNLIDIWDKYQSLDEDDYERELEELEKRRSEDYGDREN